MLTPSLGNVFRYSKVTLMTTTRSITTLKQLLHEPGLLLSQKLKLAIELHIAQMPENQQPQARQQLPFLVQF